ncbi:MAG: hypothetical protein FWD64_04035 [Acidobacteriaceae bacterium]|nr:hypothetical protein [Acidobacteriaceae bacterium]
MLLAIGRQQLGLMVRLVIVGVNDFYCGHKDHDGVRCVMHDKEDRGEEKRPTCWQGVAPVSADGPADQ